MKRRAAETMEGPSTIRSQVLQNVQTPVLATFPSKGATRQVIQRVRHEINAPPALPTGVEDLHFPEAYRIYKRSDEQQEQFLIGDSGVYMENGIRHRIVIFGREANGRWSDVRKIYCDGTFSITPKPFMQVYAIIGRLHDWVFPICYCLLTSKSQATYERMLMLLRQSWPTFAPTSATIDFEISIANAIRTVLPQCSINFCFFHLVRNFKKRLAEQHLTQRYFADAQFAISARTITSLAFVPVFDLTPALAALEAHLPAELQPIFDWFVDNYAGRPRFDGTRSQPLFKPEQWSVYQRTLNGADRTNNHSEAFHRRLQRAFGCHH